MGAWGPAVFSNDVARDVRDRYRELIEDQVDADQAEATVLEEFMHLVEDQDDGPVVWLALAASESALGRLSERAKAKALHVIENDGDSPFWLDAAPRDRAKRTAALAKLRTQLVGAQPAPRRVRRPKQVTTALSVGDVLALRSVESTRLVRIAAMIEDRRVQSPLISVLDYAEAEPPPPDQLESVKDRESSPTAPKWRHGVWDYTYKVIVPARGDTWQSAGFEVVGHLQARPGDDRLPRPLFGGWASLARALARSAADYGTS